MGIFSNLLKSKTRTFETQKLGVFTLVRRRKERSTWTANYNGLVLSVKGTEEKPDLAQVTFLQKLDQEVIRLSLKITAKLQESFKEAELEVDFNTWQDRFKLVGADVILMHHKEPYWNLTLEELKHPHAHYILFIEGEKFTDLSIDV